MNVGQRSCWNAEGCVVFNISMISTASSCHISSIQVLASVAHPKAEKCNESQFCVRLILIAPSRHSPRQEEPGSALQVSRRPR